MTDANATEADLDRPVWGAEEIGKVINRPPRQTFYLLGKGLIDADQVGRQWVSTKRRLLAPFVKREAAA